MEVYFLPPRNVSDGGIWRERFTKVLSNVIIRICFNYFMQCTKDPPTWFQMNHICTAGVYRVPLTCVVRVHVVPALLVFLI